MLHYGFRHNSEAMIHMGLSLLTVALESGSHHIGTFPSLMNYVKDDMCKNLFWVGILWKLKILIEANIGLDKGKGSNIIKQQQKKHELIHLHTLIQVLGVSWWCGNHCWLGVALWCGGIVQCCFNPLYSGTVALRYSGVPLNYVIVDCTCVNTKKLLSYKQTHLCHLC